MALKIDYITVNSTDLSHGYVNLSNTPTDGTVALDIIGGTAQAQVSDFSVDGTKVSWNVPTLIIDTTNTELRAIYNK